MVEVKVEVKEHFSFAVQATRSVEKDNSLHSLLVAGIHFTKKNKFLSVIPSANMFLEIYRKKEGQSQRRTRNYRKVFWTHFHIAVTRANRND